MRRFKVSLSPVIVECPWNPAIDSGDFALYCCLTRENPRCEALWRIVYEFLYVLKLARLRCYLGFSVVCRDFDEKKIPKSLSSVI